MGRIANVRFPRLIVGNVQGPDHHRTSARCRTRGRAAFPARLTTTGGHLLLPGRPAQHRRGDRQGEARLAGSAAAPGRRMQVVKDTALHQRSIEEVSCTVLAACW
jgi:hypothetical protein